MKKHWNPLRGIRRSLGKRSRLGNVVFKRFISAGFEPLELRALLSADALSNASAWYSSADVDAHATSLAGLSMRSMLASCKSSAPAASNASAPDASAVLSNHVSTTSTSSSEAAPVADPPADALPDLAAAPAIDASPLATGDQVKFRLEAEDTTAGHNVITSINVGQDFTLAVFVQDVRPDNPNPSGVFAAYLNAIYNSSLATIDTNATPTFGPTFAAANGGASFDFSTVGTIAKTGSFGTSLVSLGTAEQLLFRVTVHAVGSGTVTFTPSFDNTSGHDTLVLGNDNPIPLSDIEFDGVSLDVINTVSIGNATQAEGNSGLNLAIFTATLANATTQQVTAQFQTADGTATVADNDYVATSGTLTFAPGATTALVTVAIKGDTKLESDEQFSVNLSAPVNATLGESNVATGTITNDDPVPTVSVGSLNASEGDAGTTPFEFSVTLSNPSSLEITVPFNTADGSAVDASDYAATSGTLTFAPGTTTQLVTVLVNGDTTVEPNEAFSVQLGTPTNATLDAAPGQGAGSIINDDGPHLVFTQTGNSHLETNSGTTEFVFTVSTVVADPDNPITVVYTTQDGTATVADADYVATSGTLTFAPTTTTQTITVLVNGDSIFEADENFTVVLSDAVNATINEPSVIGTILNDDVPPTISFVDDTVSQAEGDIGPSNMLFTVQLSAVSQQAVTVQFSTTNGTATVADSDYAATTGTLTFAPGTTSLIVTVPINGDAKNEADETFTLNLLNSTHASNATTTPVTATGTIQNDDPLPTLSIGNQSVFEGDTGTTNAVLTVTLSSVSGQTVTAAYATSDGSATTADNDYTATSGTVTFAPGVTSQLITVAVKGDVVNEASETFNVDLSAPTNATLETGTGVGTITNDDPAPSLSINNFSHVEGNAGTTDFLFTVSLSAVSGQTVTVNFATAPVTAVTGTDFVGQSGVLTFTPGTTQQIITVAVNGDTLNEADETFAVNLSTAFNASIAGGTGTGTIQNDDPLPTLSIGNVSAQEGDSGTTPFVFVVSLSTLSGQTVTVAYATANGTATTANNDYVATSGTLTFGAGVTTQNITVSVNGDLFLEPNETFVVNLTGPVNATIQTAQGTGTILTEASDTIAFTPSKLSGFAFIDSNPPHDLQKGASEPGLFDVTVTLAGTSSISNSAVNQQTATDEFGAYTFTGLEPGTYTVTFTKQDNYKGHQVVVSTPGATALTGDTLGYTITIGSSGGVNGTSNNYAVCAKLDSLISQRDFMASTTSTLPAASFAASPSALAASTAVNSASNLITQSGSVITVHGTAGDDAFEFNAATHSFTINGVTRQFDPSSVSEVDFDGAGGSDLASLTGSAGDDVVAAGLGSATFSGAQFKVKVSNVESLSINGGGGHDTATLQDSALNDALNAVGDEVSIANNLGFATSLAAFAQVKARATMGGSDTAHIGAIDFALEQEGTWLPA